LEFIIRRCQLGDEASLSLLGKATFLETYADSTRGVDLLDFVEAEHSAQRYRSWLESEFAQIWVAETTVGRSAIAYAVALTAPNDGLAREIEIKRLYVLNRFHKRGLGSCLLNEVLAHARQTGIAELFLRVQKINQNAVNFYSGRGFRVVGEETFKVGAQDHPALVMRLTLPGSGENLRIADASIMPRVTTGNTMAPCVIIGERAAEVLRAQHMF
jgi:ribosomal protein S18 acetylase RimI-like enzyme